jgi:chemotaxis methyl-accepting protein methylase
VTTHVSEHFTQEGEHEPTVSAILALVRERTGADFTRYRKGTVARRIRNRMISLGVSSIQTYLELLEGSEEEAAALVHRVTIKVSSFYRNPESFDVVGAHVLPELAAARRGAPVRIWSAGAACGEEPYTLAMLLERAGYPGHVEATDLDPFALAAAERGLFAPESVTGLPEDLASRYLEPVGTPAGIRYRVRDSIRRRVRFSRHDLTSAAQPPSEGAYELVCCRNVLIYLRPEAQAHALSVVRSAIAPGGYLFLGEAEWPSESIAATLTPRDRRTRLFKAASPAVERECRETTLRSQH